MIFPECYYYQVYTNSCRIEFLSRSVIFILIVTCMYLIFLIYLRKRQQVSEDGEV